MDTDVWNVFRFCPRCGASLKLGQGEDGPALRCSAEGFVIYQNPHAAVAAVINNPAGEILLIRRSKEPKKDHWDLPGGFVNWGEDPDDAIVREVREELGVAFSIKSIITTAHDWYMFNGLNTSANTIDFLGTFTGALVPNDEVGSLRWFKTTELPTDKIAFPSVEKTLNILREKL